MAKYTVPNDRAVTACPSIPCLPADTFHLRPVRPILLTVCPADSRILILRIDLDTTVITVRPSPPDRSLCEAIAPQHHLVHAVALGCRMNETLFTTKGWLTICVAAWLVGTSVPACAAQTATPTTVPTQAATAPKPKPQPPLTVPNPYAVSQPAAATPRIPSAPATPTAGALVDEEATSTPWSPPSTTKTNHEVVPARNRDDLSPPPPPLLGAAKAGTNPTYTTKTAETFTTHKSTSGKALPIAQPLIPPSTPLQTPALVVRRNASDDLPPKTTPHAEAPVSTSTSLTLSAPVTTADTSAPASLQQTAPAIETPPLVEPTQPVEEPPLESSTSIATPLTSTTPIPNPIRVAERPSYPTLPPAALPITQLTETDATAEVSSSVEPSTFPYTPTTEQLSAQLLPAVQRGYTLAKRGALFAAQTEFIQVLRRVAQAKDAAAGTDDHSQSLAAGLRALDEADDFVPQGTQLEAELNVRIVASSHRTPALRDFSTEVPPHEADALYHSFAQQKLAAAVTGEQAGSMVLHGMGKIYARQAELDDDNVQLTRRAMTMYHAALTACPQNHMAANELGVLLVRTGHPAEAMPLFESTIDLAPSAMGYHNLAMAQQKMGLAGQSAANEQESQRLAAWERSTGAISKRAGVEWVSPAEMASVAAPADMQPNTAMRPEATRSTWQKTVDKAKAFPLPGLGGNSAQEATSRH